MRLKELPVKKFIRFSVVGGTGAGIQFLITWLLTEYVGLYYLLSVAVAIGIAVIWTFTWNYKWTFREKSKDIPVPIVNQGRKVRLDGRWR